MNGVYQGLSNKDYHGGVGVSRSMLLKLDRSIDHMVEATKKKQTSAAMIKGSALHDSILLPELFEVHYIVAPKFDGRTNDGKAAKAQFISDSEGKEMLSADDMADVLAMRDAVLAHPIASQLLTDGSPEESFYWNDAETGELLKCRTDYRRNDGVMVDLKSCRDATPKEFSRSLFNFGYHVQAAMYLEGASICTGQEYSNFVFIAVESVAPYSVAVYDLDAAAIQRGHEKYRELVLKYADWKAGNIGWTGYPLEITTITLPAWA